MLHMFFTVLIALVGLTTAIYSLFYEKKNLILIAVLILFSFLSLYYWYIGIFILIPIIFYKKLKLGSFITANMFSAVVLAWFFLQMFLIFETPFYFYIALITVIVMCGLAIPGIFEKRIKEFLLISSAIQILFIILDLSVAKMAGKLDVLGTIQIFNYTFAGLTLFLTIGLFARGKKLVSDLEGSVFKNKWNDAFATIACLSLAGLPAFNMFVSEWFLLVASFAISPMITTLCVFVALLLFVMYYKIVYVMLVGEGKPRIFPKILTIQNGILAISCLVLGLLPQIQYEILTRLLA
ncbi:hypothetical protein KY342_04815 [Candidatus Woesearchaeota archaeon]|nr:hypothetical protein [Candidatus Woesearchaeota archaeon]